MEAKVHAVNEIREVVDKVFVDGGVSRVHAQQILVPGLGCLEPGLGVLVAALGHLLLDHFVLAVLLQFLLWDLVLYLGALLLDHLELGLGLPELGLVGVVGLHGRVQLVEHLQHLFVNLEPNLAALNRRNDFKAPQ